jgi:hypothetical protein
MTLSLNNMTMKTLILGLLLMTIVHVAATAQTLIGKWQLTKQTSCIESEIDSTDEEDLVNDMKSHDSASPQVIQFKDAKSGEESTRVLSRRKDTNSKAFLYKFDGTNLHILDKRSRTISESYIVEKLDGESLILSNASRACDTKVFVRIK